MRSPKLFGGQQGTKFQWRTDELFWKFKQTDRICLNIIWTTSEGHVRMSAISLLVLVLVLAVTLETI